MMLSSLRALVMPLLSALLVAFFLGQAFRHSEARSATPAVPDPVQVTLDNGLKVIVQSQRDAPCIHLGLFYSAGSASEPDSLAGLAHLVEHLMFTSSENYPGGGLRRDLALYAAYANASTWQYGMMMRSVCLPQFLPAVLRLEVDRLTRLSPSPAELERERQVVLEELALRGYPSARDDLAAAIFRAGYPHHPYSRPVIGSAETLQRITLADVDNFRQTRMHPGNAVLVMAGPGDPDSLLAQVRRIFEPVPASALPSTPGGTLPPPEYTTVVLDRYDFEGFVVSLGFRLACHTEADRAMARFLASFLEIDDARTSLKMLPGEAFLTVCSSFGYRGESTSQPDGLGSKRDAQAGISALWQAIDMAMLRLLDPNIFSEVLGETLLRLNRSFHRPDYLIWSLGLDALNGCSPLSYDRLRSFLLGMEREEYQALLRQQIDASRTITGVLHGRDSGRMIPVDLPANRASGDTFTVWDPLQSLTGEEIRPVVGIYAATRLPRITTFTLRNDIPVHVLPMPGATHLELGGVRSFACLKEEQPGQKQGVGMLYNLLVDHGYETPARTYLDDSPAYKPPFAADFDVLPFELRYHTTGDCDQAAAMADVLIQRLTSDAFNLARWRRLLAGGSDSFARTKRYPATQATLFRWSALFGEDHPVLGRWQGDPQTVQKVKYKDIQDFHHQVTKTGHTQLLAAGDVDINRLADMLNISFGQRDAFEPYRRDPPPRKLLGKRGAVFPAFDQQDVRLVLSFPPLAIGTGDGPGWAEVRLLEEVLRMRLYTRLRSREGLTYTLGVVAQRGDACLVPEIHTSCLPAVAPKVLISICEELRDLITAGIDEESLLKAQLQTAGRLIRQLTDPGEGYDLLSEMACFENVPADPVASLLAVSEPELTTILSRSITPDRFVFSVTGPLFEEDIERFLIP